MRVGRQKQLSLEILPPPAAGGRCASRSLDGQAFVALARGFNPLGASHSNTLDVPFSFISISARSSNSRAPALQSSAGVAPSWVGC